MQALYSWLAQPDLLTDTGCNALQYITDYKQYGDTVKTFDLIFCPCLYKFVHEDNESDNLGNRIRCHEHFVESFNRVLWKR